MGWGAGVGVGMGLGMGVMVGVRVGQGVGGGAGLRWGDGVGLLGVVVRVRGTARSKVTLTIPLELMRIGGVGLGAAG